MVDLGLGTGIGDWLPAEMRNGHANLGATDWVRIIGVGPADAMIVGSPFRNQDKARTCGQPIERLAPKSS